MKTFYDRLLEMPMERLRELIDREQKEILVKQRDLDTMNRALQQRTANSTMDKSKAYWAVDQTEIEEFDSYAQAVEELDKLIDSGGKTFTFHIGEKEVTVEVSEIWVGVYEVDE